MSASLLQFVGCKLGFHAWKYVGMMWVEDFPGCKSGHDNVCSRCGREEYFGRDLSDSPAVGEG